MDVSPVGSRARRGRAVLTVASLCLSALVAVPALPALAASVAPVAYTQGNAGLPGTIPGNEQEACRQLLGSAAVGYKLDSAPAAGTSTFSKAPFSVTLTADTAQQHFTFQDAAPPVRAVIVKGASDEANDTNVYLYPSARSADLEPHGLSAYASDQRISHIAFCVVPGDVVVPFAAPTADKTAVPAATVSYGWDVTKSVAETGPLLAPSATAHYTVTATRAVTARTWSVSGAITVYNSNPYALPVTVAENGLRNSDLSDYAGDTCALTSTGAVAVPPGSTAAPASVAVPYACTLDAAPGSGLVTNTATVGYTDDHGVTQSLPVASEPFGWSAVVPALGTGSQPATASVLDYFDGSPVGTPLTGGVEGPAGTWTYTYTQPLAAPAAGCRSYPNRATVQDGTTVLDDETASVTICRPILDGRTMGYWQNKNGQADIKAMTGVCGYLAGYGNVLTDLPSTCTASKVATWATAVIKAANASGTGAPMFKGQFLATALSAERTPALKGTSVTITDAERDALGLVGSCHAVLTLLNEGNSDYATLVQDKAALMLVKSLYDKINQNLVATC